MPTIIIQDISNVIIDGKNCDDAFSACAKFPELATEIQIEVTHWSMRLMDADKRATESATALAEANARTSAVTAECNRLANLLTEASAAFDAGDVAKLQAMRAEAQKSDKQKALEAALAEKAAAEAKIAELSA